MKVLFDVAHPAHVHFYRHLRAELLSEGHEIRVISREKDVTIGLLEQLRIPHRCVSTSGGGLVRHGRELIRRVLALRKEIDSFRPDLVLTRNPAGVQAAAMTPAIGVFDTDDGSAAGIHFRAAKPFANVITTPACLREDFGPCHRRYDGFKALAYLHPNRFQPDPTIREMLGVEPGDALFLVRFSAYTASHDRFARGLTVEAKIALIKELDSRGTVLVSDEDPHSSLHPRLRFRLPPEKLHDVLATADLCVGDSQSVAAECAMLGTPAFRLSSFVDKLDYLAVLEQKYGLVKDFAVSETSALLSETRRATENLSALRAKAARGRAALLSDCVDVTSWYRDLLHELAEDGCS